MTNRARTARVALAAVLLTGWTAAAHAFVLGDLRGSAVIGRPLDVAVQVQWGADEEASAACLVAEVYHADVRQSAPKVSVFASGNEASVRVVARTAVDEPVVSLVLRSTCGSTVSKRYVLLADFPAADAVASLPGTAGAPRAAVASVVAGPSDGATGAALVPAATLSVPSAGAEAAKKPRKVRATRAANPTAVPTDPVVQALQDPERSPPVTAARKTPPRATGGAVLKLDPLDILSDRIDGLDSVMTFTPTEDAVLHAKKIDALQNDVNALKALAAQNEQHMTELRNQLAQANAERASVVGLYVGWGVLLLALGAMAGWVWYSRRKLQAAQQTWWQPEPKAQAQATSPETELFSPPTLLHTRSVMPGEAASATSVFDAVQLHESPEVDLDIDLDAFSIEPAVATSVKAPDTVAPAPQATVPAVLAKVPAHGDTRETPVSGFGGMVHSISVEPILDIRQQAEFFVSLGQTERALRILKKQISDSTEPNPLVYLDLLALLHSLGLKAEFREYRAAFNHHFNGVVPDFGAYHAEGLELMAYPEVLNVLVGTWPSEAALMYLDACIFHNADLRPQPSFQLAAFRDLLMLHSMAEEVASDLPWNPSALAQMGLDAPAAAPTAVQTVDFELDGPDMSGTRTSRMVDLDFSSFEDAPPAPSPAPVRPSSRDKNPPLL